MRYNNLDIYSILKPYVKSINVEETFNVANDINCFPTIVLPTSTITLLFNYGDPFIQIKRGQKTILPRFYIAGQMTRSIEIMPVKSARIIIVMLYPWAASKLLPFPINEFTDLNIDLDLVIRSSEVSRIESKLKEAMNLKERIDIIQDFLLSLLHEECNRDLIYGSLQKMTYSIGNVKIDLIADNFNVSRRHFMRKFKEKIGLAPKLYSELVRFKYAIQYKNQGMDWSDITFYCGYYDQSHFVKEFKKFTGVSPQIFFTEYYERVCWTSTPQPQSFFG